MKSVDPNYLVSHHVGGRGGTRSLPTNPMFENEIVSVLYEADPSAIDQIKEKGASSNFPPILFCECLSNQISQTQFYISYDPNLSSFLKANSNLPNYYYYDRKNGYDYVFNDLVTPTETISVSTTSMDNLLLEYGEDFPKPDFISLDTQGTEMLVLEGANECLNETLGVLLEIAFVDFYDKQPLFAEVFEFLNRKKFSFVRFTNISEQQRTMAAAELRSRGFLTDGDALFLISPEELSNRPNIQPFAMYKLAYLYLAFDMLEECLKCMDIIYSKNFKLSNTKYQDMLNELYNASLHYTTKIPTFTDKYDAYQSRNRYVVSSRSNKKIRSILKDAFIFMLLYRFLIQVSRTLTSLCKNLILYLMIEFGRDSGVECILKKNGFLRLCRIVKRNRLRLKHRI